MANILVLDDDKSICETLSLYLGEEGHSVGLAYSAEEGFQQLRREGWEESAWPSLDDGSREGAVALARRMGDASDRCTRPAPSGVAVCATMSS